MNLLITMGLSDRSMKNHIFPIANLNNIEKITIIRNTPGPDIDKVKYHTPSQYGVQLSLIMVPIKLFQLIRASLIEKPSLIHSYLIFPHGYLAFIAGKLTGRKVGVSLIAGPVETYIFGGSPIDKYAYCQPLPQSHLINRIIILILKRFDVITVTGTYTENFLINKGIDRNKIWILPHVVDERFRTMNMEKDYDLIYIGRLAAVKHVETIIRAVSIIKEFQPGIKVAIVGDGEERGKLEELTQNLDLNNEIDFVGYQANTWEWYNRSKISILTSEREGFPYSVIESIKCGVPVIISDCGDENDLIKDSFNGRIISNYKDFAGYANVILELIKNPNLIDNYSNNCLKTFENDVSNPVEYVWERILLSV